MRFERANSRGALDAWETDGGPGRLGTVPISLQDINVVKPMDERKLTMAQQVAKAASAFQTQRTGHAPRAVTVVLSEDTLVITLHGVLSPAETALAESPEGAAQVKQFHRELFASSAQTLRQEIKRITGVDVREAAAEVEPATGTVVQVFTTGTMVQVFLLAEGIPAAAWHGNEPLNQS